MKCASIGDIFEIPTKSGLRYAQYTHEHPTHSSVLKIFQGIYKNRPRKISSILDDLVEFTVLFPIQIATRDKLLVKVGHENVRQYLLAFPNFRTGVPARDTNVFETWWFWYG